VSHAPSNRDAPSRLVGMPRAAAELVAAGAAALQRQQAAHAEQALLAALQCAPEHPEVLRLLAIALRLQNRNTEALELSRRAAALHPHDALIQNGLGTALDACGDHVSAIAAFRHACELAPQSAELWANLGKTLGDHGRFEDAVPALERALQLTDHGATRLRLAYALRVLGRIDAAAQCYRQLLARNPADGTAWLGLAMLKTRAFAATDVAAMQDLLSRGKLNDDDRISLGFALAKALDDHGRYAEAFPVLTRANAQVRRIRPWDATQLSVLVDETIAAFARAPAGAPALQGDEVIFIVSLPRAGSSLTEQILASHPQIEGAGELDELHGVIGAESLRRGLPFPRWVAAATPADWQRLGQEYLTDTARWRQFGALRFTDKLPGNWLLIGAAMAMLPGARIIDCRRDPLEACFSCFRTLFSAGYQEFSYDLADMATYWRDYERTCRHWHSLFPQRMRVQNYEALIAQPEQQIAELLEFCGVPFDSACLHYTETQRSVRTASASQVREPLMRDTAHAAKYGALLDPLRIALAAATTDGVSG
jgi:tetratricopeptide (TPR) repeat protein